MLNNFEGEPMAKQPQEGNIDPKSEEAQRHFEHIPVLPHEVIEYLNPRSDGIYVDCTLGGGGHATLIAERIGENGKIIGIDQDPEAIKAVQEKLSQYEDRVIYVRDNFRNLQSILEKLGIDKVDGILMDLGVSSYQLETPERGFSFNETDETFDQPLDMRMDPESEVTAFDVINNYSEQDLRDILYEYGEEPKAGQIAHRIVQERKEHKIETTNQLLAIIKSATSPKYRFSRKFGHYASKVFRAIRMEVNEEPQALSEVIPQAIKNLNHGGRLVIISFHSSEDRIVKKAFRSMKQKDYEEDTQTVNLLTKKPITAQADELKKNPKSASAKLRAMEII